METEVFASKPQKGEVWDIVIIGSGPSAFTAAVYTTRGAASTLILAGELWGGQLMNTTQIDNFPGFPEGILGPDLMAKMRKQTERFGAEIIEKKVEKVDFSKTPFELIAGGEVYKAKSVIITTGAQTLLLGIPGEKEFMGRGVSTCAPCDAPFFKNKKVAVIGGGDTAMEEANVLTKYATEVIVIHRRDSFKASEAMQKKVLGNPKIKVIWNTEITEVIGSTKVEKLLLKDSQTGKTSELIVDGLFVAIGHKPDSDLFKGQIEMDEKGFIKPVAGHGKTNIEGVFVAGDVMDAKYKQAITSAGSGCAAAMEALAFLENKG
jgi:thioredoxin reductase (NADPH)